MKRSQSVRRVLLGGLTAGAFTACTPSDRWTSGQGAASGPRVTTETYFANDDVVPGAGYYHAPFRGFFPLRYNHYDPTRKQYFFGGQWSDVPHRSIVNLSAPTPEAARLAEALHRTSSDYVQRSGFGSSSGSRITPS